jgi:hypothetical protein
MSLLANPKVMRPSPPPVPSMNSSKEVVFKSWTAYLCPLFLFGKIIEFLKSKYPFFSSFGAGGRVLWLYVPRSSSLVKSVNRRPMVTRRKYLKIQKKDQSINKISIKTHLIYFVDPTERFGPGVLATALTLASRWPRCRSRTASPPGWTRSRSSCSASAHRVGPAPWPKQTSCSAFRAQACTFSFSHLRFSFYFAGSRSNLDRLRSLNKSCHLSPVKIKTYYLKYMCRYCIQ